MAPFDYGGCFQRLAPLSVRTAGRKLVIVLSIRRHTSERRESARLPCVGSPPPWNYLSYMYTTNTLSHNLLMLVNGMYEEGRSLSRRVKQKR